MKIRMICCLFLLFPALLLAQDSLRFVELSKPIDFWDTAVDVAELPGGYLAVNTGETGLRILARQDGEFVEVGKYSIDADKFVFCYVENNVGYVASEFGLESIDLSDPTQPVQIEYVLPGIAGYEYQAMDVQDDCLVLVIHTETNNSMVLHYDEVGDGHPGTLNGYNLASSADATDIILRDNYVYIIQQILKIYDFTDLQNITLAGTVPVPNLGEYPRDLQMVLQDTVAWVVGRDTHDEYSWLQSISVADPHNPWLIHQVDGFGGHSIDLMGNDAFIISSSTAMVSNFLHHFHLNSSTNPEFIETTTESRFRGTVSVAGGHIYACSFYPGLMDYTLDTSNHLQLNGVYDRFGRMQEMQVYDDMILAGADIDYYFYFPAKTVESRRIFPISIEDPEFPQLLPTIDLEHGGNTWYREPYLFAGLDSLLTVYDYTDWEEPVQVGQWEGSGGEFMGLTYYLDDELLILPPTYMNDGLLLFDISDPTNPTLASTISVDVTMSINILRVENYLVEIRDTYWKVYDISDLTNPVPIEHWEYDLNYRGTNCPLWIDGNRLYIYSDAGDAGFEIDVYEIALPDSITYLYTSTAPAPLDGRYFGNMAGKGRLLAATTGRGGLYLFDVSHPGEAELLIETEGLAYPNVAWYGDRLVLQSQYEIRLYEIEGLNAVPDRQILPATTQLGAAWPNPFNPSTTIPFSLKREGWVKMSIYDLLGRRVTTLVNADYSAGLHRVEWDGRSASGLPVASGSYLVRLQAEGVNEARRVTLLK